MGLTIHYNLEVPKTWTPKTTRQKLEALRQSCLDMPVEEVGELFELKGDACDFEKVDNDDPNRWAIIQAMRHLHSPWEPGTSFQQSPSHMMAFSVWPAQGCEEMNIGINSYSQYIRKPNRRDRPEQTYADVLSNKPAWSLALDREEYRDSLKVLNAFAKRWNLRRLPLPNKDGYDRLRSQTMILRRDHYNVRIVYGRYQSHRLGYAPSWVLVELDDRMKDYIRWKFKGTVEEAERIFTSPEFKADMDRLVHGEKHVVPPLKGFWKSFCKTQYANDPEVGGIKNFLRAHLAVCAILEKAQDLGFKVTVRDEGDFWTKRDVKALAEEVGEWDQMIAGLFGAMKDALPDELGVVSPIAGRSDFEQLEFKAQSGKIGDMLGKFKEPTN